jgi:hypothetical protein
MKKSNILLILVVVPILIIGCKNEDLSAPKTPKMSADTYLTSPIVPTTPISPVGTEPAGPTKEAAATTSLEKSAVSKTDQSAAMPLPGQANDHSALLPKTTEIPKTKP